MKEKVPNTIYKERIDSFDRELDDLKNRDRVFSIIKLIWVLGILLVLFKVIPGSRDTHLVSIAVLIMFFVLTAIRHETVLKKIKYFRTLTTINKNEQGFLELKFPKVTGKKEENGSAGEEFKDSEHPYTSDMDIFGEKGIFHYINRGVTAMGRSCLASWLKKGTNAGEIKKRQDAVTELAPMLDLRQAAAAHGINIDDSAKKLDGIYQFLEDPAFVINRPGIRAMMIAGPLITFAAFASMFFGVPLVVPLAFVVGQMVVAKVFFKPVSQLYKLTTKCSKVLKAYGGIIKDIESSEYKSPKLKELKERLMVTEEHQTASAYIKKLGVLLEWFDVRRSGSLHFIVNHTLMWDLHCVYRIEKWRTAAASRVPDWFEVIGEFEALSSFASLHFNNPGWTMPEVTGGVFSLEGKDLGHPLIPEGERVCNDVAVNGERENDVESGNLLVITGPNMAGKSTFLRTVGVNMLLAFAGAPVCGKQFRITRVNLFTSMQTSDSLDKHLSLFYAELQRLKMILDGIERGEPVFFIIDEMLKGTNALDRQKGAIAMLNQLLRSKSNGIVATHDLELTKLKHRNVKNVHFDGYVEDDKLLFDYLLKDGTCKSFNALALMKTMGIDL